MYPHYNIHPLFDTLPAARQKTYLKVAQSDHSLAQDLYLWNLETTSAVFQTISFVEVTMRNVFDKQLRTWNNIGVNGNSNWIVQPKPFLAHQVRNSRSNPQSWWENKAIANMKDEYGVPQRANPSHDDMVAALTFGTWASLIPVPLGFQRYNPRHRQHEYWTKILCSTDNNINGKDGFNTSARQAYLWVSKLRYARNRAAHLEPMLNSDDLREYHRIAIETLRALQPGSEEWVLAARKIPSAIQNKPSSCMHTLWAPNCSQYIS